MYREEKRYYTFVTVGGLGPPVVFYIEGETGRLLHADVQQAGKLHYIRIVIWVYQFRKARI